ncbi:MAG: polyphosphate polymerase domain-containing protein, partial [Chloroflexi bacterium]|nr:polyphosphate polymerase domain-containing protein [Chloroflexota bacterium]
LKYLISYPDAVLIKMRLNELLEKDHHVNSAGSYTVRSLYFDDYYNNAYNEKYMGVMSRQKYRIRIYNNSDHVIRLERKIKSKSYIYKQSAPLNRAEVDKIMWGEYAFLLKSSNTLQQILYYECVSRLMRPRVIVDYERDPYIFDAGSVRVTFDKNVRAGVEALDLFNSNMAMVETLDPGKLIMEVKFTEFLPNVVREILPPKSAQFASVSKYVLCCDKTLYKRRSEK